MDPNIFHALSYGLYIVSTRYGEKKNGYVANTVFQVTAEPAQVAISCNKKNLSSSLIAGSGYFSVSVLAQNASKEIIGRFGFKSGEKTNKFEETAFFETDHNIPVVTEDCVAWFLCKVIKTIDTGTHLLFIGEMLKGDIIDTDQPPLTYDYYRKARHGRSPKNAPTYLKAEPATKNEKPLTAISSAGKKWICTVCDHIYNPAEGDPEAGIAPGTPFEDLPDSWVCPVCGAEKADFIPYQE